VYRLSGVSPAKHHNIGMVVGDQSQTEVRQRLDRDQREFREGVGIRE